MSRKNIIDDVGNSESPHVISFTLDELKKNFKEHTIVTTIQCAGNRRAEMSNVKQVNGLSWYGNDVLYSAKIDHKRDSTALSTAKWSGILLSDVLAHIGINEKLHCRAHPTACPTCQNNPFKEDEEDEATIEHVHLEGLDTDVTGQCYGASIPISTAIDPRKDVLLAYSMNGVRITVFISSISSQSLQ
jgi:sulfite oxidase